MRLFPVNNFNQASERLAPVVAANSILSRRAFLQTAATGLGFAALNQLAIAESKKTNEVDYYTRLSPSEEEKILAYHELLWKLWDYVPELHRPMHPEALLDESQEQQQVFAKGGPFEFKEGYLYHGRADLGKILLEGSLPKNSFLTRVPQTWALQAFVDLETDPAIYVIDALDFNRWQNQGKATLNLKLTTDTQKGISLANPYPSFNDKFPLDSLLQIIVTQETYDKYAALVKQLKEKPSELSGQQRSIAERAKVLFDKKKIVSFTSVTIDPLINDRLINQGKPKRLVELNKQLEEHLKLFQLSKHMPGFRKRTESSTGAKDRSPPVGSIKEAAVGLSKMLEDTERMLEEIKAREKTAELTKADQVRKAKLETLKTLLGYLLGLGGTVIAGGSLYWVGQKINKLMGDSDGASQAQIGTNTRKRKKKNKVK